ncbi:sensor histidine kinase [Glacieibacterium frigidum]|uniref:sensor histidine kinase n=1 Tax=Glacieibacterium frigidum TaxID=2593303 RepID=UPI00163D4180|nr:sensor histidine kinase [Glacieibacterium frigidum]
MLALLALAFGVQRAAAGSPELDARLAAVRADAMRSVPAPEMLAKIPAVIALSKTFETGGEPAKAGAALNSAVIYALLGGDLRRAIAIADRAAGLCAGAGDRRCYGNAMNQSGIALWRLNDPYAAMQRLDRGARAFVDAGDIERAAIARLNAANIRYDIGDLTGALADYDRIDRLYGNSARWDPVGMLASKAEVLVKLGRLDEARGTAQRAAAMLQQRGRSSGTRWESDVVNSTRGVMALVEASLGNAAAALPLYQAYVAAAEKSGSPLERHNAHYAFAEGLMLLGRATAAYPHVRIALDLIDETDPAGRRDTYDLASRIAADSGRTTEALDHLRNAEKVRNELAATTLRSAIADANAQTAVAEREAQLARRDAAWATQRTQLLGLVALAVILTILVTVVVFVRYRARTLEQRYAAVLDERTRLARELHDTLLQGFTGITLQLRAAAKRDPASVNGVLSTMADEAGRWVSETRQAVWDMRAATSDHDLQKGLEQAIATTRTQSDAQISLDCELSGQPGQTVTGALLRVAQEALGNAARHASATRIDVAARTTAEQARLSIVDDGVGFRAAPELSALGGHWGLLGMRERIEALGGVLTVDAAPGRGTRVTAEVPL